MVARRRGSVLIELVAALFVLSIVVLSLGALLRRHAMEARMVYEERAAWEIASGQIELLEARGGRGLTEGRERLPIDAPGWENLPEAACVRTVSAGGPGAWRVAVEVRWAGYKGIPRTVEARTTLGRAP